MPRQALITQKPSGLAVSTVVDESLRERYAERVAAQKKLAPDVSRAMINTSPTGFKLGDTRLGPEIDVVILGFAYSSNFYGVDAVYDPDKKELPYCYAVNATTDGMVPAPSVLEPESKTCEECPHSKFGSASRGRGKACREYIRLAVASSDSVATREPNILHINLPPTARKLFAEYLANINGALGLPLFGVVSKLYIEELKAGFTVGVELVGVIDDGEIVESVLEPVVDDVHTDLLQDPKFSEMDLDGEGADGENGEKEEAPANPAARRAAKNKPTPARKPKPKPKPTTAPDPKVAVEEAIAEADEALADEEAEAEAHIARARATQEEADFDAANDVETEAGTNTTPKF